MMRWNTRKSISGVGETRSIEKFLFLPLNIEGETRWLENAKWEEEVSQYANVYTQRDSSRKWDKIRWIDD